MDNHKVQYYIPTTQKAKWPIIICTYSTVPNPFFHCHVPLYLMHSDTRNPSSHHPSSKHPSPKTLITSNPDNFQIHSYPPFFILPFSFLFSPFSPFPSSPPSPFPPIFQAAYLNSDTLFYAIYLRRSLSYATSFSHMCPKGVVVRQYIYISLKLFISYPHAWQMQLASLTARDKAWSRVYGVSESCRKRKMGWLGWGRGFVRMLDVEGGMCGI